MTDGEQEARWVTAEAEVGMTRRAKVQGQHDVWKVQYLDILVSSLCWNETTPWHSASVLGNQLCTRTDLKSEVRISLESGL
jgi:hypothetical protein